MTATDDDYDGPPGDKKMPLLEHLIELRSRLMWSALAFFIALGTSFSTAIVSGAALRNPARRKLSMN